MASAAKYDSQKQSVTLTPSVTSACGLFCFYRYYAYGCFFERIVLPISGLVIALTYYVTVTQSVLASVINQILCSILIH